PPTAAPPTLEVILTTTIDKLGKAGEVVKVAPGHFRNHLMPKMLAVPNMDKFAILIREQRKLYQREEEVVKEVTKEDDDARVGSESQRIQIFLTCLVDEMS
ncbi:uncharacterized protein LOC112885248, partial [Panicum hallii]|uniref:uncharacterized protein LOC112885248 n=1 Tax=Panicum hallii TaxID=206008 RepID=UPI000DF4CE22